MNTTIPIYNNMSIRSILSNLPKNMIKIHKIEYIKNCIFVYKCEQSKMNLGYSELVRTSNHLLIKMYYHAN